MKSRELKQESTPPSAEVGIWLLAGMAFGLIVTDKLRGIAGLIVLGAVAASYVFASQREKLNQSIVVVCAGVVGIVLTASGFLLH